MSERDFDFDLIMGLAAGDFPPDEAAEIEAGLDAAARRELASQRAALQAFGLLRQPALSAPERRRLQAAVRAELGIAEAPEAGRRPRRRKVRWARAFPALAAAAALVVVIGVARNEGRDSAPTATATQDYAASVTRAPTAPSEQSREAAAATQDDAVFATTTMQAAPTTTTMTTAAMQAADMEAAEALAAAEEAGAEADQAADSPPATTAAAGGAGAGGALPASFDLSVEGLLELGNNEELLASFLDEYAAGAPPYPVSELEERAGRAGLVCWEAAEAAGAGRVLFAGAGLIDGSEGEAYIIEEDGAAGVRLFNAPDCTNLNP